MKKLLAVLALALIWGSAAEGQNPRNLNAVTELNGGDIIPIWQVAPSTVTTKKLTLSDLDTLYLMVRHGDFPDCDGSNQALQYNATTDTFSCVTISGGGGGDADTLDTLDSTAFAILAGQSGGQTLIGGTGAGDDLTLQTTSNASKGSYILSELTNCDTIDTDGSGVLSCGTDASGSGGTANILDLADDATDESTDLIEIATTGDTNNVFTEPTADKLLITVSNNWPTADTANAGDSATAFFSSGEVEDARVVDALTVTTGSISDSAFVLDIEAADQTADGDMDWDTTEEVLEIGDDGTGTHKFVPAGSVSGDITMTDAGVTTIGANTVALGTDTTGNYAGAGSEGGAATDFDIPGLTNETTIDRANDRLAFHDNSAGARRDATIDELLDGASVADIPTTVSEAVISCDSSDAVTPCSANEDWDDIEAILGTISGDATLAGGGALTIAANSVALGTDTTGNYAAGDAEGGAATSGDSATAFFSSGEIEDARVVDTITASNYLPLAGGTMTGSLVTDNLGVDYTDSDTNPSCSAGEYKIYADTSETTLKKCVNGTTSDLDTTGGGGTVTVEEEFDAGSLIADGTQCGIPTKRQINSGPYVYSVICTDNDAGRLDGSFVLSEGYTGTISVATYAIQTAADTNALEFDFAAQCRGDSDAVNNTWSSEVAVSITFSTANDEEHSSDVSVTPDGTCAAGDTLYWKAELDATATTTAVATAHLTKVLWKYDE